jgi:hypothetical protein
MTLFEDTNPRDLKELLGQIHSRETALPDFQRDFVWDPKATAELIVSIASNYPAGSLLRIRNTHDLFACREFQGAPVLNGHRPTYLVLDGQQRLTSLYQAFYGVGDHRYYIDLRALLDGADFEDCLLYHRAKSRRAKRMTDPEKQAAGLVMPLSVLKAGSGGFGRWTRAVARKQESEKDRVALEDRLAEIEEGWISTIDDYRFPVVTLSDDTGADAVCTIFETLNRTGVKLSAFELLTARFWPQDINLRALWDEARERHPIIEDFEVDPYYLLQSVALAARPTPSCKRSDVLALERQAISDWWGSAVDGLGLGLSLLRDDCGVALPRWLPYDPMLIPLAAILAKLDTKRGAKAGGYREKVVRWFWSSVFGGTYDRSSNSQSALDFGQVLRWCAGGLEPDSVARCRFDPSVLRDVTPKQRGLYRGTMCVIMRRGPRDFHNGAPITGEVMIEEHVDDHHIFPTGYLSDSSIGSRIRNCILNRTLIDRSTNIRIGKRAPSDYLGEIRGELGETNFSRMMASHLLPAEDTSPLWEDDFDAFLAWRQESLWADIQELTGAQRTAESEE